MAESFPKMEIIEGIPVPDIWDAETFRSALNYKAQPDDIFLVAYPKSGTTWMQVILYTLMNDVSQLDLNDRLTCLAFNAKIYEVMDYESANMAKLKLALILSNLKPSFNDSNPSTALYNAIETSFQFLLRNKLTGLFTDDSNRNRIILSTDGEDVNSIKSSLIQACEQTKQNKFVKIGIQTC
ncbi:unnamed protein product [Rotaria sordida]|uniref:Sulfotransferase domain-containing protein n=1 Tax=Rotaria sordida TaxID=392033 RepID=A0A819K7T5_9BILA|nr:unnamed protein product [Rotaria sordida]